MTRRGHYSDYTPEGTARCERALVTLLGDLGPWRERIYLAGGLAPRYIVGALPAGAREHAGTTDVDLIIGLALGDETPGTYRTLQNNLEKSGFEQADPSFRWVRNVEGLTVQLEFLCETNAVEPEATGTRFGAFNVRGAHLARDDFKECVIEAERLDGGGRSRVNVRVTNVLPYTALKIFAFQDRHENKDSYDLGFTLLNFTGGPAAAGSAAASSPVREHSQVVEALVLLEERFRDADQDGPHAYAEFLATSADEHARLRQDAVAIVRDFLTSFHQR